MPLKSALKGAFHHFGGLALVRSQNRNRTRILAYHRFPADHSLFIKQCQHLRRYYTPLTLSEIATRLRNHEPLPPNAFTITVDDGYLDFFLHAFPVLKEHGIPATVFLMTDFVDGTAWPWWDQVEYAFRRTALPRIEFAVSNTAPVLKFELRDDKDRQRAADETAEALKTIKNSERLAFVKRLPELFQTDVPEPAPAGYEGMTWDHVRTMAAEGIDFGGHTMSHPILSSLANEEEMRREIGGSRDRIANELGRAPANFCYPNGLMRDIGIANRVAEAAGFQCAVSAEPGLVDGDADLFLLRRIVVDPDTPELYVHQRLAGMRA